MSDKKAAEGSSSATKREEQLARLKELQMKRNQARKLNHEEVVEEDRRKKQPENWDRKQKRLDWEEEQHKLRMDCLEKGLDYNRVKLMEVGAVEAEKCDKSKKRKHNPDTGFADFEQATFRQYQRLTKQLKPDMGNYDKEKKQMGEAFYPTVNTLGIEQHKDTKEGVERMVSDLEKQIEKRTKYSRRRAFDEDEDIDYINERNMKFNKKLERFYGKYTAETKQNLERGTAI